MCGIFGILASNGSVPPLVLERATDSLAHRGPDDRGTVVIQANTTPRLEIGLGSRRLAVIDLSPLGHQPMQDAETGNWIVYNGEIYNFRELRTRLQGEGVRFVSQSDTEVLLKAYGRWGEKCVGELRGMFAFAIWDAKRSRLLLGRDPMGIKPLYYCSTGQYLLFASELRTLLGTGLIARRIDPAGLISYLNFGSLYDPITMIRGVSALQAGHYAVWEGGRLRDTMYWDLAPHGQASTAASYLVGNETARKGLEDDLYATLDQAVRMQTVSDVPVGLFLSGGIDSSSLAGILSRAGIRPNTFSIIFREADYSEAEYSRAAARAFGTEHQEIMVSQGDALDAIPYALRAMDQPTIDGLNTYLISRQTRAAGIKVALSGLGGDELFAGYSSFRDVPRMERFDRFWGHWPAILRRPLARMFCALAAETDQNRKLAALGERERAIHPYFLVRALFTPGQRNSLLTSADEAALARANAPLQESLLHAGELDPINRVSYLEARCYMLNTLLRDCDVMSMAHGLELRVPLIDHQLADKLMVLPGAWKLDGNVPKPLLVGALKGALPGEIVHRKKQGFTLPFEGWLRENLRSGVEGALQKIGQGPLGPLLNQQSVMQVWDDFMNQRTSWSRVWSLYVLERWCELNSVTA
ncbi:MAG: asparagine synthase (glutamine-hydrolyzing) [Acidobacteriia bacterium]|nr:asparagine synthase (glutamine-hydrolyzing) [Terriglobia bacterium]